MVDFTTDTLVLIVRILVGALLGGLVGLERDLHGRAAGLRTHLLVSMGAALFTVLSEAVSDLANAGVEPGGLVADPGRISAQIVTGIGFLGAGAILKEGLTIRGLTTAACLWVVASIGMAAGAGYFLLASTATAAALAALVGLKWVERAYPKDTYRRLTIVADLDTDLEELLELIRSDNIHVLRLDVDRNYEQRRLVANLALRLFHRGPLTPALDQLVRTVEKANIPLKQIKWES